MLGKLETPHVHDLGIPDVPMIPQTNNNPNNSRKTNRFGKYYLGKFQDDGIPNV